MSAKNDNDGAKAKKDALLTEIEGIKKNVITLQQQVKQSLANINSTQETVTNNINVINDAASKVPQILQQINGHVTKIEQQQEKVCSFHDSMFVSTKEEESYEHIFQAYLAELKKNAAEINNTAKEVKRNHDLLFGFNETKTRDIADESELLPGETPVKHEDGSISAASVVEIQGKIAKINELQNNISEFIKNTNRNYQDHLKKWGDDYETIKNQVYGLLPGAAAAGLSNAYNQAKEEHAKKAGKWEIIFGVGIAVMIIVSLLLVTPDLIEYYRNGANYLTWDYIKIKLIHVLPFVLPALWFVYHANKVTNEHRRLRDEYTHKWAVSNTYIGLKVEMEELETQNAMLMDKLIKNTIDMHAENPTSVLSKEIDSDNPIFKVIDRIIPRNIDRIISKFGLDGYSEMIKGTREIVENIATSGGSKTDGDQNDSKA